MTREQRTRMQHAITYAVVGLVLAGLIAIIIGVVSLFIGGGKDTAATTSSSTTTTTTTVSTTTTTTTAETTTTTTSAVETTTTTKKTTTASTTKKTTSTTKKPDPWPDAREVAYFVEANASRYDAYHAAHPKQSPESVVLKVNMNLDRPFYEDPIAIQKPNSLLVLCNKYYYLKKSYVPSDLVDVAKKNTRNGAKLRKDANTAFKALCAAAEQDGIEIRITTAYRSYSLQNTLYTRYVNADGKKKADTYSARPGYSEHQTGLAMDLGGKTPSGSWDLNYFEDSPAFDWMQEHAAEYGFILRYPEDKVSITGYQYEPWHYRYVGQDIARVVWDEGICWEEYCAKYLSGQIN